MLENDYDEDTFMSIVDFYDFLFCEWQLQSLDTIENISLLAHMYALDVSLSNT
jgi:hypothetical protein